MVNPFVFTIPKAVSEVFQQALIPGSILYFETDLPTMVPQRTKQKTYHAKKAHPILKTSQSNFSSHPTPNTTSPTPNMTNDRPPSKKGLRVFQPTILTWHSVKKVKYSSPSFCTLNRPHLSDISSPSPLVSIGWYDDRGRMISTWRGTVDAQKKNQLWKKQVVVWMNHNHFSVSFFFECLVFIDLF